MDWCLDPRVAGASDLVEAEIAEHLDRHAIEPGVVELARPIVRRVLDRPDRGPVWATLDWSRHQCALRVRALPAGPLPGQPLGPGATLAHEEAARLAAAWRPGGTDPEETHELGVARVPERDIDPPPAPEGTLPSGEPAFLLGMISGEISAGRSLEEAAARAGTTLADLVARQTPLSDGGPVAAARRFIEAEGELGGEFEMVEADGSRVMVRNRRCPFGPATGRPMCRFTSALAGSLAARDTGSSEVSVMESLAAGDRECRLVIDTGGGLDPIVSHAYGWPPVLEEAGGRDPGREAASDSGRSFQVTLSLQLPRDRLSVPITRHLIRAAMDEVGVVTDDGDAVDLAVTEACANVIDHSGPGDAYDVAVTISPAACHIRVVDVGRGFDHHALSLSGMAAQDAEHGRGLALMHALVDQVRFESEPEKGTVVHLVKRLSFEEAAVAYRLLSGSPPEEPPPS